VSVIDTHAHLDGYLRQGTLPGILARAREAGVAAMIAIGTEPSDWTVNREIARANPGFVHATAGLHPCTVDERWEEAVSQVAAHWGGEDGWRPVALGECGLDRFHLPKDPAAAEPVFARQREAFRAQLGIARTLGCPLVVHSRGAFRECVAMIGESGVDWSRVVFHCFSEGPAEMAELNALGGRGSFTGILTYKNAESVRSAALQQGLDRLMLETDAPYLAPVPHRGKPNEPAYVSLVAAHAAAMFGVTPDEIGRRTSDNARAFFGL
jgi:TatD DNase family protein